jgi:two-component system, NarL family, response regulator NreC
MNASLRVLLGDDHGVVRAGLRALIQAEPDMTVVAEVQSGSAAVTMCAQNRPDVVVLDISMPLMSGIEATRRIVEQTDAPPVLILSMHEDAALVRAAASVGAAGYLAKRAVGDELISAIRAVHAGRGYLNVASPAGLQGVFADAQRAQAQRESADGLTPREHEVLELLAYGYTNQEVAERLHLSGKTVGTYRARLAEKLGLNTRAEIVRYALETSLLAPGKRL